MISEKNKELLLQFAHAGFKFFPLNAPKPNKKFGQPKGWRQLATSDTDQIRQWLTTNEHGFAMAFEDTDIFVFDLDIGHKDGVDGVETFKFQIKQLNIPKPTLIFKTPSGGLHVFYKTNRKLKNIAGVDLFSGKPNKGTGIDIRTTGGFIGSFGAKDNGYTLIVGDCNSDIPEFPDTIQLPCMEMTASETMAEAISEQMKDLNRLVGTAEPGPLHGKTPKLIANGERDNTLFQLIGSWVRSGLDKSAVILLAEEALGRCEGNTNDIDIYSMVDRTIDKVEFARGGDVAKRRFISTLIYIDTANVVFDLASRTYLKYQNMRTKLAGIKYTPIGVNGDPLKPKEVFTWWENQPDKLICNAIGYKPGAPRTYFDNLVNGVVANKYVDPKIKPIKDDILWEMFRDFAYVIAGESESKRDFIMEFVAFLLQQPSKKTGVALVIISPAQGTGKNFFFKIIDLLLGSTNTTMVSSEDITSRFNSQLSDKQLVIVNESVGDTSGTIRGNNSNKQAMARIKNMITETAQSVERKGIDSVTMNTYANFVFLSNDLNAVQMVGEDRRFSCIINHNEARDRDFFDNMDILKTDAGLSAIKYGLMSMKLSLVKENMVGFIDGMDNEIVTYSSLTPLEQKVTDDINNGRFIFKHDVISLELFRYYLSHIYPGEVRLTATDKLIRKFCNPLLSRPNGTDKVIVSAKLPAFEYDDQIFGKSHNQLCYCLKNKRGRSRSKSEFGRGEIPKLWRENLDNFQNELSKDAPITSDERDTVDEIIKNIDPGLLK